jgi:hypothetical protein
MRTGTPLQGHDHARRKNGKKNRFSQKDRNFSGSEALYSMKGTRFGSLRILFHAVQPFQPA